MAKPAITLPSSQELEDQIKSDVFEYLKKHLPEYRLVQIIRKSVFLDDSHLYMVIADKNNGQPNSYALWTCYNSSTQSLNHGHYNLTRKQVNALILQHTTLYYQDT